MRPDWPAESAWWRAERRDGVLGLLQHRIATDGSMSAALSLSAFSSGTCAHGACLQLLQTAASAAPSRGFGRRASGRILGRAPLLHPLIPLAAAVSPDPAATPLYQTARCCGRVRYVSLVAGRKTAAASRIEKEGRKTLRTARSTAPFWSDSISNSLTLKISDEHFGTYVSILLIE